MSEVKAIFITGGGSGIGRAVARLFASRGWRVGIADVNESGLAESIALIGGGMAQSYVMDVRDRDAWAATLDAFTHASGGRLDVLHNNAGIGTGGPLAEADFDELDRTVAINLMGVINGARIGHAYLAKTPGSCLLNTASASAIYGSSGLATYSATKFGVRALTEALDGEWNGAGIKVRDIIPGFIETPLLDRIPGKHQPHDPRNRARCRDGVDQRRDGRGGRVGRGTWRQGPHLCRQDRAPAGVRRALDARQHPQTHEARAERLDPPPVTPSPFVLMAAGGQSSPSTPSIASAISMSRSDRPPASCVVSSISTRL